MLSTIILAIAIGLNSFGIIATNYIVYKNTHKVKRRKRNVQTSANA